MRTDRLDRAIQRQMDALNRGGRLIEAGFVSLRAMAIDPAAPASQVEEMRNAFFAGAAHLLSSILSILDPGTEPTAADLERMSHIQAELDRFIADFEAKHFGTGDHA